MFSATVVALDVVFFLLWMQFGEGVNKGCGCLDYTFCCNDAMECGLLAAHGSHLVVERNWIVIVGFFSLAQNPSLPSGMTLFHKFTWSCKG